MTAKTKIGVDVHRYTIGVGEEASPVGLTEEPIVKSNEWTVTLSNTAYAANLVIGLQITIKTLVPRGYHDFNERTSSAVPAVQR